MRLLLHRKALTADHLAIQVWSHDEVCKLCLTHMKAMSTSHENAFSPMGSGALPPLGYPSPMERHLFSPPSRSGGMPIHKGATRLLTWGLVMRLPTYCGMFGRSGTGKSLMMSHVRC
ncbi:hypothetical protein D1007_20982 [Hordeum vulgare]|nr:hypothetical protein D1007_20982 [Hordeum vulgare]